jgi:hypothetical protein
MKSSEIEYMISEMMGPPERLAVESSGAVRFESHTNLADAGMQPVGTFAMTLTQQQMRSLLDAFEHPPFGDLRDHWGKIASGQRYKSIKRIEPSGQIEKRVGTALPVSPPTQALIDRLDQIVKDARLHPLENLALRVSEAHVDSNGMLRAKITFTNPSTEEFFCIDPAAGPGVPGSRLGLSAWPDRDASSIHSTDIVEANSIEVRATDPMPHASGGLLKLPAGAAASFRVTAVLRFREKVPYVIRGEYQNTASSHAGRGLMEFEVYSPIERIQ